jgi:aspartyl-tRNA(Asn)/glutamyl-tRNA(Gln) amidotransferase subunit B
MSIAQARVSPDGLVGLIQMVTKGDINQNTAKTVLHEMFDSGKSAEQIVSDQGLLQISDSGHIAEMVKQVLTENPDQVNEYLDGKDAIAKWLFGQVMRAARAQANPQVVQAELDRQLAKIRAG